MIDSSTEDQRLALIRQGHPYGAFERKPANSFSQMDQLLCCPSRILFNAVFMRWNMVSLEKPKRYILTDTLPYSESMERLSDALYRALCSEKPLLRDILIWGGVKVSLDDDYMCSLTEVFHVWSIWNSEEADQYRKLRQELRENTGILDKIAKGPKTTVSKAVELDLFDEEFDQQLTETLTPAKKWVLDQLGVLGRDFKKPEKNE